MNSVTNFPVKLCIKSQNIIHSPLEQFAIENYSILDCWTPLTNSAIAIFVPICFFLLACSYFQRGGSLVAKYWPQALIELIYEFVYNLVQEQVGKKGFPYFPFVFSLFSFLLVTNLFGMLPITFTSTSHFIITFGLSVSVFIGVTVIGFQTHGLHFFSFLLPPGAPLMLAPLLVVLELVSYSFRAISLGVRAEPLRCSRVHTLRANGCRKAPLRLSTKDPL